MNAFLTFCALALACALAPAAQATPLRDPFARPPMQAAPAPSQEAADAAAGALPVLRAILVDRVQSMANIGGHIVAVGDQVGAWRVQRIDERSVTLLRGRTKSVLEIDRTSERAVERTSDREDSK